jgi:hypothetical protein
MKPNMYGAVTLMLVIALLIEPPLLAEAQAQPPPPTVLELCVLCVVVAVGTVIIVNLCKLAKKIPAPDPDPPKPPAGTNAPPKIGGTITTSQSAGDPVPIPAITLQFDDSNVYTGDISAAGFTDPDGDIYYSIYGFQLRSSTNLTSWQSECCVTGWVSAGWIVTVGYTNGLPSGTNWCNRGAYGGGTNTMAMPIQPAPAKFFQVAAP